jgi:hypothetical protein
VGFSSELVLRPRPPGFATVGTEDDAAYRRSVRNTSALLVVIVIVVIAGLLLPAYFGSGDTFSNSTFAYSPDGLTLNISLNTTRAFTPSGLRISIWINLTSGTESVAARSSWAVDQSRLWERLCTTGWPIGIGVMHGYYDQYNYSSGSLLLLKQPLSDCVTSITAPQYFLIQAQGSSAIVSINGTLESWNLQTTLVLRKDSFVQNPQTGGTVTVIGADEWGDVAILHFITPQNLS